MGERKVTCHLMEIIITKDMKEKVLSTAPEIFSQKGNEGTNIRDLSASCGLVNPVNTFLPGCLMHGCLMHGCLNDVTAFLSLQQEPMNDQEAFIRKQ